jgi:hypothetical protein
VTKDVYKLIEAQNPATNLLLTAGLQCGGAKMPKIPLEPQLILLNAQLLARILHSLTGWQSIHLSALILICHKPRLSGTLNLSNPDQKWKLVSMTTRMRCDSSKRPIVVTRPDIERASLQTRSVTRLQSQTVKLSTLTTTTMVTTMHAHQFHVQIYANGSRLAACNLVILSFIIAASHFSW